MKHRAQIRAFCINLAADAYIAVMAPLAEWLSEILDLHQLATKRAAFTGATWTNRTGHRSFLAHFV